MKKLFSVALGLALVLGMAACASNNGGNSKKSYSDKVLANEDYSYHATGGWDTWSATKENKMEATSIAEVAKVDEALADKLVEKDPEFLYVKTGIELGTKDGGFNAKFKKDGKIYSANGSYTVKSIRATYEEEDQKYVNDQWIPDPHTAQAEALTANIFFPTYQEAADEDGFEWSQNPVVTAGAGVYTLYVAQYKAGVEGAGYGFGLVKTAEKESEYTYEEVKNLDVQYVSLIGSFAASENWSKDVDLTKGETAWTINNVTLAADDQVKVRLNHNWDDPSFGFDALDTASATLFTNADGNMKVTAAGVYNFSVALTVSGTTATAVITVTEAAA